jgi:Putative mono-oxygenase ydhR
MYRDGVIVAIVRFPIDPSLSADEMRSRFEASAPSYQDLPGLRRKHYLLSEDGATAGGVYLWDSRGKAEAAYDEAWHARMTQRYGTRPTIEYFESPVTVEPDHITVE